MSGGSENDENLDSKDPLFFFLHFSGTKRTFSFPVVTVSIIACISKFLCWISYWGFSNNMVLFCSLIFFLYNFSGNCFRLYGPFGWREKWIPKEIAFAITFHPNVDRKWWGKEKITLNIYYFLITSSYFPYLYFPSYFSYPPNNR